MPIGKLDMFQHRCSLHYTVNFALSYIICTRYFSPKQTHTETQQGSYSLTFGDDTYALKPNQIQRCEVEVIIRIYLPCKGSATAGLSQQQALHRTRLQRKLLRMAQRLLPTATEGCRGCAYLQRRQLRPQPCYTASVRSQQTVEAQEQTQRQLSRRHIVSTILTIGLSALR